HGTGRDHLRRLQRHRRATATADPLVAEGERADRRRHLGEARSRPTGDVQAPQGLEGSRPGGRRITRKAPPLSPRRSRPAWGPRVGRRLRELLEGIVRPSRGIRTGTGTKGTGTWNDPARLSIVRSSSTG